MTKFTDDQYDKLIELLSINPLMPLKNLADNIKGVYTADIQNVFTEIRKSNDAQVTNDFISSKIRKLDPIWFMKGIIKSFLPDRLCQSSLLSESLDDIANKYEKQENEESITFRHINRENIRYSYIYRYFARLIDQAGELPELKPIENAIMLNLLYEITNLKNSVLTSDKDFMKKFTSSIQDKTAQFLLKIALPPEKWNEKNEKAFIKSFNIPTYESILNEIESSAPDMPPKDKHDALLAAYQKKMARFSLNPFSVNVDTKLQLKSFILSDIIEKDTVEFRNVQKMCRSIGVNPDAGVKITSTNKKNDKLIISETKDVANTSKSYKKAVTINVEDEINRRMSKHTLVDLDAYNTSLIHGVPQSKKRKASKPNIIDGKVMKKKIN